MKKKKGPCQPCRPSATDRRKKEQKEKKEAMGKPNKTIRWPDLGVELCSEQRRKTLNELAIKKKDVAKKRRKGITAILSRPSMKGKETGGKRCKPREKQLTKKKGGRTEAP